MFNKKLKIIFLIALVFLGLLNLYSCVDDMDDLTVEDENLGEIEEEVVDKEQNVRSNQYRRPYMDEDDEFDDPVLLNEQLNKGGKRGGVDMRGPRGIPQAGMQMPGMPMGGEMPNVEPTPQPPEKLHLAIYEIAMFGFVISFIIACFLGKRKNENLATKWFLENKEFLEENYAHIGVSTEYNTRAGVPILKESYNNFKFYASGRVYMKWLLVNMEFKKRQDLVSLCTSIFLYNEKDRITYESSLTPTNDLPVVFCICKKKDVKSMKKSYSDIDFFTKPQSPYFMNDNLVFLTEDYEMFEQMFSDKTFVSLYKKVEPYIDIIYFTDRQTFTKEEHSIFFSFDINNLTGAEAFSNITLFVHSFIDLVCNARISSSFRKESERMRNEYIKLKSKELQEKNAEEMRQKKLEKMNKPINKPLTVEQAQKLEEKEKREALKNQKKKQMKVVKK